MPFVRFPDGTTAHVCIRGNRSRKLCSAPGCTAYADRACDFPVNVPRRKSRTCDAPICNQHAAKMGDEIDYCPPHKRYTEAHE